ncbi:MAG TPA: sigma-54-dependent Fis family transcriptional regulator [Rhodobacteraceae bacterium]|nr:sigma-54-dependent Fis family transcriptional regulator [Paracoccaceae bacterium]
MSDDYKIAIIDDEAHMRDSISQWLELSGFKTLTFENAEVAFAEIGSKFKGIVVSDIRMPGMGGMELLKRLHSIDSSLPVILITGHGDVQMAVEAMQIGAYDFMEKPFDPERLADLSKRAIAARKLTLENRALRRELSDGSVLLRKLMGTSPSIEKLREDILDIAFADSNVHICGETGTGKSLIAHAIHACGPRQGKDILTLNCAALDDEALTKHLFGPSDSADIRPIAEMSEPCTLCLEDAGELSADLQAKLLSFIESLDTNDGEPSRVRIISVSSLDEGTTPLKDQLRPELFFRLSSMEIMVPTLRERGEDTLVLFSRFTQLFAEEYGIDAPEISATDAANLLKAQWPGNIRQLQNLAERVVMQSQHGPEEVSKLLASAADEPSTDAPGEKPLKEHVEAFERMLIDNALRRHTGSVAKVMEELVLPRRTLNEKMAKYGLSRADYL